MLNFSLLGYVEVGFLKRYPYPCQTDTTNLNAVVALAQAGNQIKLNLAGKLGLGEAKSIYHRSIPPVSRRQYDQN